MLTSFSLGEFNVRPQLGVISTNGNEIHVEPKVMEVLVCLAGQAGEVVPKEKLLQTVWADTFVTEHVLKVTVSELRKALGDDAKHPRFIQTIPKQGYRLIAEVAPATKESAEQIAAPSTANRKRASYVMALAFLLVLGAVAIWKLNHRANPSSNAALSQRIKSIAVLPLRDLSGNSADDYFADGMTEAITTDLVRTQAFKVISTTSAMRYKNTQRTTPEIARALGADAVIEGSVLRSANEVRIIIRFIDGVTGEQLWNEKYERQLGDVLALQNDLAADVVRRISVQLNPKVKRQRAIKPEAYEAYL
jgi:TolB-like protein/DNA-binding winged helix-turn-helix (wHTH) protein